MHTAGRATEIGKPKAAPTRESRTPMNSPRERILFVTGKLAEYSLTQVVEGLSQGVGFDYRVAVLPISVAALMHVDWVKRKLRIEEAVDRVVVPGWCQGDLRSLSDLYGVPFERGPKDLHELPDQFGRKRATPDLSRYDIEIIAEINHATRQSDEQIVTQAAALRRDGADVIDIGCVPGEESSRAVKSRGY